MPFKVNIFGLGKSGAAAAELCLGLGYEVVVFDEADNDSLQAAKKDLSSQGAKVELAYRLSTAPGANLGVASPGIGENSFLGKALSQADYPIISEIGLAVRFCRCPILAITGTNGKTTVTEMSEHFLRHAGKKVLACGNIGYPLSRAVMRSTELDFLVVEISSFQLEKLTGFAPYAAALLNITSDHLDRHGSMARYADVKFSIFNNIDHPSRMIVRNDLLADWRKHGFTGQPTVFSQSPADDVDFHVKDGDVLWNDQACQRRIVSLADTTLRGSHNAENLMAALALLWRAGIPPTSLADAIKTFKTGAHRIELFAEKDGIVYVNDSKSTTPDSTVAALRTFGSRRNVCLIAGGLDKDMDFSSILSEKKRIKQIFLVGKCSGRLAILFSKRIPYLQCESFETAVENACETAKAGDIVLLSPACASMDMFKNYIERGETFKSIINRRLSR